MRSSQLISEGSAENQARAFAASDFDALLAPPPLPTVDWQLEAEVRKLDRTVRRLRPTSVPTPVSVTGENLFQAPAPTPPKDAPSAATTVGSSVRPRIGVAIWSLLCLGFALFACGGVLLGWSIVGDRSDLWPLGLTLTLVGQAGLLLGLVMQLEALWRGNRHTAETLTNLDGKLTGLRQSATLLNTSHSSPSQKFYLHLAEGASSHLLLADLKGQLDLLSQHLAAEQRR